MSDNKDTQKEESPQEVIQKLGNALQTSMRSLNSVKSQLLKTYEQLHTSQDEAFTSLQNLANYKEEFYVSLINLQNQQLRQLKAPPNSVQSASSEPSNAEQSSTQSSTQGSTQNTDSGRAVNALGLPVEAQAPASVSNSVSAQAHAPSVPEASRVDNVNQNNS